MFTKRYSRLVTLCFCVMLAGCATSRSEIKLHSPEIVAPAATATSAQRVIVIGKITDERVFEDAPSDPSTPSLGFGGAGKAADDVKARAVARKRNGYGKAMGDVLLQSGQTVDGVIRDNLTAAFLQAGYQVKDASDAGPSPLVVDVRIKTFWAWFEPGFWAITLSNNISTDLVVSGVQAPIVVSARVEEKHQAATDSGWIDIVDKGLDAYRAELLQRLQGSDGARIAAAAANTTPVSPSIEPAPAADASAATVPAPVAEARPEPVMPSPSAATTTIAAGPVSAIATTPQGYVASSATTPLAQSVATGLGCGAVQSNGATTYVASCGTYGVLIDCDGGQCRPLHTIRTKDDE